jgi:U2 small nuclear ribonucleoprotein A'
MSSLFVGRVTSQKKKNVGNMAKSQQHYRYWVIWRCPTVRFLDFQKVRDVERQKAAKVFGTADAPTELAASVRDPLSL